VTWLTLWDLSPNANLVSHTTHTRDVIRTSSSSACVSATGDSCTKCDACTACSERRTCTDESREERGELCDPAEFRSRDFQWRFDKVIYPKDLSGFSRLAGSRRRDRWAWDATSFCAVWGTQNSDRSSLHPCRYGCVICRTRRAAWGRDRFFVPRSMLRRRVPRARNSFFRGECRGLSAGKSCRRDHR